MAQATGVTVRIEGLESLTRFIEKMTTALEGCESRLAEIESATKVRSTE